ncbi:MAG: flagellar basal body-associated FliL family protein [Campylobacterota bacterium]|nr:flagellar basal body-associated FliL family protein [Campylobacterota bacterium]
MAEETEATEKKSGGNPMMIVLIILIVVLLAAVGGIGYFLYSKGMFDPEASNNNQQTQEQAKEVSSSNEEKGEIFLAKVDSLVLNITDAKGRAHLMKLSFTVKTNEATIEQIIETNKAEIIDAVIREVSARSSEELLTVGGKDMLKDDMLAEINNILNDATDPEAIERNCVKDLYFTSFVIK